MGALSTGACTTPGDTVGPQAVGKMRRVREMAGKTSCETTYYLLSAPLPPERFAQIARAHWGIENQLHWYLDVTMSEDAPRNGLGNGPQNLAVLRHVALNVLRADRSKGSHPKKMRRAARDGTFLVKRLAQF